jgi:hypothetical protein
MSRRTRFFAGCALLLALFLLPLIVHDPLLGAVCLLAQAGLAFVLYLSAEAGTSNKVLLLLFVPLLLLRLFQVPAGDSAAPPPPLAVMGGIHVFSWSLSRLAQRLLGL